MKFSTEWTILHATKYNLLLWNVTWFFQVDHGPGVLFAGLLHAHVRSGGRAVPNVLLHPGSNHLRIPPGNIASWFVW